MKVWFYEYPQGGHVKIVLRRMGGMRRDIGWGIDTYPYILTLIRGVWEAKSHDDRKFVEKETEVLGHPVLYENNGSLADFWREVGKLLINRGIVLHRLQGETPESEEFVQKILRHI